MTGAEGREEPSAAMVLETPEEVPVGAPHAHADVVSPIPTAYEPPPLPEPSAPVTNPYFTFEQMLYAVALHATPSLLSVNAIQYPPTTENILGSQTTCAAFAESLDLKDPARKESEIQFEDARGLVSWVAAYAVEDPEEYAEFAQIVRERLVNLEKQYSVIASVVAEPSQEPVHIEPTPGLPDFSLLLPPTLGFNAQLETLAQNLVRDLQQMFDGFNVTVNVQEKVNIGPTNFQFSILPGQQTKVKTIQSYRQDMQRVLAAKTLRVLDPLAGTRYVGIEIPLPDDKRRPIRLREILETSEFQAARKQQQCPIVLGRDVSGRVRLFDLHAAPHVLVAGATGSGKSGVINALLCSILMNNTPDEVRLTLVDPKVVELSLYEGLPHLTQDIITDMSLVVPLLSRLEREMQRRNFAFKQAGVRSFEEYNQKCRDEQEGLALRPFPLHVVVIEELANVMQSEVAEEVRTQLGNLLALTRAAGIHFVVATQRPSVDVVAGVIKANIPTRIACMVSSSVDSRVIIDMNGAELLLGRGDLLFMTPTSSTLDRMQGAFLETEEIKRLVEFWKQAPQSWDLALDALPPVLKVSGEIEVQELEEQGVNELLESVPTDALSPQQPVPSFQASSPTVSTEELAQEDEASELEPAALSEYRIEDTLLAKIVEQINRKEPPIFQPGGLSNDDFFRLVALWLDTQEGTSIEHIRSVFGVGYKKAKRVIRRCEIEGWLGPDPGGGIRRPVLRRLSQVNAQLRS